MIISSEELQHLRERAEAATPGPWRNSDSKVFTGYMPEKDRLYGSDNDFICGLYDWEYHEYVDESEEKANATFIAAANPQTIIRLLDELERLASGYKTANEAAQELRVENARLNKEADWLADHCREFCESYSYCGECPMFSGWLKRDHEDCGEIVGYRGEKHTANWREAARKAAEGSNE